MGSTVPSSTRSISASPPDPAGQAAWDEAASFVWLPPTHGQRNAALAVAAFTILAFGAVAPFALTPLPRIDSYIPAVQALIAGTDFMTAVLLFGQFAVVRTRALLVLASGYLFSALSVVVQTLTFPGAFSPTGLLGADAQTAAWIYVQWHVGFVGAVGVYALLKPAERPSDAPVRSTTATIAWAVAIVLAAVGVLSSVIIAWSESLPPLVVSATAFSANTNVVMLANLLLYLLTFALLWSRRSSVLDWWLMVAVIASIAEAALIAFIAASRYTLAFYSSRGFAMLVSSAVLIALLWEITKLYAKLSRAVRSLQRERLAKLMNLEVMLSAVAHEIKQPLTAIVLNASATEHLLKRPVPDVAKLRENVEDIRRDSLRVSEAFESVRGLFKTRGQERQPIDANALLLASLEFLSTELKDHEIRVTTELAADLPAVSGHRGQLQEVFVNILRNAIESMSAVNDRLRTLRLGTQQRDGGIAISIEDSGVGIEPKRLANLFDAFVTTKPGGMGLGLGICRMIIDRHGGLLSATSELGRWARFEITLPMAPAAHLPLSNELRGAVKGEA